MIVLYQDNQIAVCVKDVGMDSEHQVPSALETQLGGTFYSIHRLDKNVGGVMVFARTPAAAAALSHAVQSGSMVKEYLAAVHGIPPEQGDWEDLLWKDSGKNKVYVVKRPRGGVKKARLEFWRLTAQGSQSLVHIRLHTGRSHQIRVQFASRGYPLVGDHKYGSRDNSSLPKLWSFRLSFPYGGTVCHFQQFPDWLPASPSVRELPMRGNESVSSE